MRLRRTRDSDPSSTRDDSRVGDDGSRSLDEGSGTRDEGTQREVRTGLDKGSWGGVLKRTVTGFKNDNCTDWAAALTYYGVLAMFPALIAMTSLISLVGDPQKTTNALLKIVGGLGPSSAVDTFAKPINQVANSHSAGLALILGLAVALWSASGYVGAFGRAANAVYDVPEGRPFYKLRPVQLLLTLVCIVLIALVALSLVVTGPVARVVGNAVGLGSTAVTVWDIAKWPVMILVVSVLFSLLYYATPNVKQPKFRWFTLGGLIAVLVWIVASAGFALYVANFSSYNKTYGSLAAVVVFLLWLWLSNCAVLFGAEFNAELERGRQLDAGMREAERTIQLPPRDTTKMSTEDERKHAARGA